MTHSKLLSVLDEDARRERESLLKEAREESRKIIAEAASKAETFSRKELAEASRSIEAEISLHLNEARRQSEKIILEKRHEIVESVFSAALGSFDSIDSYRDIFETLMNEVLNAAEKEISAEYYNIYLNSRDMKIAEKIISGTGKCLTLISSEDISYGVVLGSPDGKIQFINTLPSRLEAMKAHLKPLIRETLFGSAD